MSIYLLSDMAYKLYTDKANKFNCNIEVEGTSLAKSQVRLVIESDDMSYMFKGSIQSNGECEVTIPKTKSFLPEGTIGNMRLEVIADDVYFEPWSSDFSVATNKKVTVQIAEQEEEKPKMKVQVVEQKVEPKVEKPKVQEQKIIKNKVNSNSLTKEEILKKILGK
jgi:hypothetical protein